MTHNHTQPSKIVHTTSHPTRANQSHPTTATHQRPNNRPKKCGKTHLVVVPHDRAFPRTAVDPGDKVFHVTRDEECRVCYRCGTDTDVALFDGANRLREGVSRVGREGERGLTSETDSAILRRTMTTARRRRANAETVTLFSMSDGFEPVSAEERVLVTGWK